MALSRPPAGKREHNGKSKEEKSQAAWRRHFGGQNLSLGGQGRQTSKEKSPVKVDWETKTLLKAIAMLLKLYTDHS
jgi:hypothetical protein